LLPAPEAAHYLGVSQSTLRTLGIPRRQLGAKRLYDRLDLDEYASSLPTEGQTQGDDGGVAECDGLFGVSS
jgi:hypothetical protein